MERYSLEQRVHKFEISGYIQDAKTPERARVGCVVENIAAVHESVV